MMEKIETASGTTIPKAAFENNHTPSSTLSERPNQQALSGIPLSFVREQSSGRWREILTRLGVCLPAGKKLGPCPACGGKDRFRFDDKDGRGTWFCNQCDPKAGDGFELIKKVKQCSFSEALAFVKSALNLQTQQRKVEAIYDYVDAGDNLQFQVVRFSPKDFRQRRPNGSGGWIWNLSGVNLCLYKLPLVVAASHILVLEGEKDVETAFRLGLPPGWAATCNPMGAGKWSKSYTEALEGKHVVVLPDSDDPGERHGSLVACAVAGKAASVKRLSLPDGSKDLSEWAATDVPQNISALLARAQAWTNKPTVAFGEIEEEIVEFAFAAPVFPLEVLPPVLKAFVSHAADSLPVPADLIAGPLLACLSAAIGASRAVQPKPNWTTRSNLYIACIADPGSLKSPALNLTTAPVVQLQSKYQDQHRAALTSYEEAQLMHLRSLDDYRKNKVDTPLAKPEKPILTRTYTGDITIERLACMLQENPRGVLIIRDELSAWIKGFNQYKGGKGADKQFFLSAWSGEPIAVDRQGKDPILVSHPFLSVVGCIPPDVLPDLDEDNREDGFLHRLLFLLPDPVPVRWTDDVLDDVVKHGYADLLGRLYSFRPDPLGRPIVLELTLKAKQLFVEWHDQHCVEQESLDLSPFCRGAYAKLKGYAPRFALIHALATNPDAREVTEESIGAAADLVEYFKIQAKRVDPLLGKRARTPLGRCQESIKRAFARKRQLTKREAQRSGNATAELFNAAWDSLLARGVVIPNELSGRTRTFCLRLKDSE
jgi:hypothetical protein